MARLARLVVPGLPHLVTQRGNRAEPVFFEAGDYALYKDLLRQAAQVAETEVWCYCLLPSHVHLIVVPSDKDGLRRTFAEAHRRYTVYINTRMRTTGHLWQGRFASVVMDEIYLEHAVRHVALAPVRAGLVNWAAEWPWSSVAAHMSGQPDGLVSTGPVRERYGDFAAFLDNGKDDADAIRALRQSETTGRPLGSEAWLEALEERTSRILRPQKRGPKPKQKQEPKPKKKRKKKKKKKRKSDNER
jgi:putative transposase